MKQLQKSRGITPLWRRAVKHIPKVEMGIIYIAHEETSRKTRADSRS